ncbi:MAG: helicase-related protein, partial [Bacteroidota bacterium]
DVAQRREAMNAFQNPEDETRLIFITMAAAEAINLQSAKCFILLDTPWSAGDYLQLIGRMLRIGSQHDRCYVLHFVTKNSIDERVMAVLQKKMNLVEKIIGKRIKGEDDDDFVVSTENDVSELFRILKQDAIAQKGAAK